jgi:hypothetical protein
MNKRLISLIGPLMAAQRIHDISMQRIFRAYTYIKYMPDLCTDYLSRFETDHRGKRRWV